MKQKPLTWPGAGWFCLALALLMASPDSDATLPSPSFKSGAVYARDIVRDADGNPVYIYVEYNSEGEETGWQHPQSTDTPLDLDLYRVMSATQYRALVQQYKMLIGSLGDDKVDEVLKTRREFTSGSYTSADGSAITPPEVAGAGTTAERWETLLREDTATVVIAPQESRYSTDPTELVLLQLPIDPRLTIPPEEPNNPDENLRSLLLKTDETTGEVSIFHQSVHNIGFRVGFYGTGTDVSTSTRRSADEQIYGPLTGVPVSVVSFSDNDKDRTDSEGKYKIQYYLPSCPGFIAEFNSVTLAELHFKRFDPQGGPTRPYSIYRWDKEYCYSYLEPSYDGLFLNFEPVSDSLFSTTRRFDFPIDLMVLNGRAQLTTNQNGAIPLGETRFDSSRSSLERVARESYDLDGDGAGDTAVLGKITTDADGNESFIRTGEGGTPEVQGVWLSSKSIEPTFDDTGLADPFPDLTRLPDWSDDFEDRALLSSISEEDLADTDLYVFRESDGTLLMERKGLDENERYLGVDSEQGKFAYTLRLVGSRGRLYGGDIGSDQTDDEFSQWQQTEGGNDEALQKREADHLRPGERVRIIAINRASGYLGSKSVELQAAGSSDEDTVEISFNADDIQMLPPNLKVWAERQSRTELGMSKDEINSYLVGSEGAGMSDDQFIVIYSEWLDPEGLPLPEGLADYGYTARLARIVSENTLKSADSIDSIAIKPGKQMALIRLPDSGVTTSDLTMGEDAQYYAGNEHFYVQVNGQPHSREADFSSGGQAEMLAYRPSRFVPILAPVFDEETTDLAVQTWNSLNESQPDLQRPEPIYQWRYRPEYQFSVYDLQMREINRQDVLGETQNLLELDQSVISSTDEVVQLLYDLTGPSVDGQQLSTLDAYSYDGNKELVFAFGEQEISATVDGDGQVSFDDISQLSSLNAEDYLSIQLYANNDPENVLWEWAFYTLGLSPGYNSDLSEQENTITLTADDVAKGGLDVLAYTNGQFDDFPVMQWGESGEGTLSNVISNRQYGSYKTTLVMPPAAGSKSTVYGYFDGEGKSYSMNYTVTPGAPAYISVSKSGKAVVGGLGEITLTVTATDEYGNHVADGTVVGVAGPGIHVTSSSTFSDGVANVSIKGSNKSGEIPVEVRVGKAQHTETITVYDVQFSFPDLSDIPARSTGTLTIAANSDYGNLEGLKLDLAAHNLKLGSLNATLDSTNSTTVSYTAGEHRGMGQLSARVSSTASINSQQFFVTEGRNSYLESNVLVLGGSGSLPLSTGTLNYSDSTNMVIAAAPGETVTSAMDDIFEPPVYPLQDYRGLSQSLTTITDLSSGLDASAVNLTAVGTGHAYSPLAWQIADDGYIEIPEHTRTDTLEDAGINFILKVPALNGDTPALTKILDWDNYGLELYINEQWQLVAKAHTQNGEQKLVAPIDLSNNQWRQVALHKVNGILKLGVDDKIYELTLTSALQAPNLSGYHARFISSNNLNVQIGEISVYDWQGESKVTFANGSFSSSAIADANGTARIAVQAHAPHLAYQRIYADQPLYASILYGLNPIPPAYAQSNTVISQACAYALTPVSPDAPDPAIERAEKLMATFIECVIRPKVEKARIKVETSSGIYDKSVALVNYAVYEGIYLQLNALKGTAVMAASCIDAAITGNNASGAGRTCDFITSLLLIGDVRDLLIQSYHYHFGDRENYDELTAQLAGIGAAGSALSILAPQVGITINALSAAGKTISKTLKLVGPMGRQAANVLGSKIGKIVGDSSLNWTQRAEKLSQLVLPVMEVTASVALIYSHSPDTFKALVYMLNTSERLDRMTTWINGYSQRLATLITARPSSWLNFFVRSAHAGLSGAFRDTFKANLQKAVTKLRAEGFEVKDVADAFHSNIELYLELISNPNLSVVLKGIPDDFVALRAMNNIYSVGGPGAVDIFAKLKSFSDLGLKHGGKVLTTEAFVSLIGKLELSAILKGADNADAFKKELAKLFKSMGSDTVYIAKGAQHHLGMLMEISQDASRGTIKKLEYKVDAATGNRVMDLVLDVSGKTVYIEAKGWQRKYWREGIRRSLNRKTTKGTKDADVPGQMMRDFGRNWKAIKDGKFVDLDIEWRFSPEGLDNLDADTIRAAEEEIRNMIINEIKKPGEIRSDVISALNLAKEAEPEKALNKMIAPDGKLSVALTKMIRIEPYAKTVEQLP